MALKRTKSAVVTWRYSTAEGHGVAVACRNCTPGLTLSRVRVRSGLYASDIPVGAWCHSSARAFYKLNRSFALPASLPPSG